MRIDGTAIAFVADDTGQREVYPAAAVRGGTRVAVSGDGGALPRWSHDGKFLLYLSRGRLMSVEMRTAPAITVGTPQLLFRLPEGTRWTDFNVTPDGKRFLSVPASLSAQQPLTVVLNWTSEVGGR